MGGSPRTGGPLRVSRWSGGVCFLSSFPRARGRRRDGRPPAVLAWTVGGAGVLVGVARALVPGFDYFIPRHTAAALVPLTAAVAIALSMRRAGALGAVALAWLCAFSLVVDVVT